MKASATKIYQIQNKVMHKAFGMIGMPYQAEKSIWIESIRNLVGRKNIDGLTDLTLGERREVIAGLIGQGARVKNPFVPTKLSDWSSGDPEKKVAIGHGKKRYPGRPKNMDVVDRAAQMGKIEALLTVGKKKWSYADTLAKRICKLDHIGWVKANELYKIITALRKQAIREGWDLSGEM